MNSHRLTDMRAPGAAGSRRLWTALVTCAVMALGFAGFGLPAAEAAPKGKGGDAVLDVSVSCSPRLVTVTSGQLADGTEAHPISNVVVVADGVETRIEEPFEDGEVLVFLIDPSEYPGLSTVFVKAGNNGGKRGLGEEFAVDPDRVCDPDGDGVDTPGDNCPNVANPGQEDGDGDDLGDVCDEDADGDGFQGPVGDGADCDDGNAAINPDAEDVPDNGIDEDCDGSDATDIDTDGDGIPDRDDADDDNDGVPDVDDDFPLDPAESTDTDGDGFGDNVDCGADDPAVNPDAEDIPNNGIDENCDGVDATNGGCVIGGIQVETRATQAECDALVAIYTVGDGAAWPDAIGWNTATDPCFWQGVLCDSTGVYSLELNSRQIPTLAAEVGDLMNLTRLAVANNDLTELPAHIGKLKNLSRLDLGNNALSELPAEIGDLSKLTFLFLQSNSLTSLPPEIGNLVELKFLIVGSNFLTSLPPEIGNLAGLTQVSMSFNSLTSLPPEIGNLTQLTVLGLRANSLASVPPEISNLDVLQFLTLEDNQLTGDVTPWAQGLTDTLTRLELADGAGGNSCLTTTDATLAARLDQLDPGWDQCP